MKYCCRLILLTTSLLLLSARSVHALDLMIDLPFNAGRAPMSYYSDPRNSFEQEPKNSSSLSDPIPQQPVFVKPTGEKPIVKNTKPSPAPEKLIPTNENFPELACLKDNVDFWEKVYSDVDVNEGIFHDRNNLGRVYSVVTLPKGDKAKTNFLRHEKKTIESRLVVLANKVRYQEALTLQEKELAKLFSKKELTYKNVMEASNNVRVQTGLKSQFIAGVRRSIDYMPIIFPIVKQNGLPMDLAYLPHVESSYNARAGSKVGALGLWQLMPSTMKSLEGNKAVYKRTDPGISTKAAMKLLKMNYEKTGSWPLALTAYNHGANGIVRAIEETKSRDLCKIIEHYDSPSFKFASSNFYAQFLAARKVAMKKYKIIASTQHNNSQLKQNLLTATGGTLR